MHLCVCVPCHLRAGKSYHRNQEGPSPNFRRTQNVLRVGSPLLWSIPHLVPHWDLPSSAPGRHLHCHRIIHQGNAGHMSRGSSPHSLNHCPWENKTCSKKCNHISTHGHANIPTDLRTEEAGSLDHFITEAFVLSYNELTKCFWLSCWELKGTRTVLLPWAPPGSMRLCISRKGGQAPSLQLS